MIYLVRQGETDWNLNKKFNGCTDIKLNQTGIAQAKQQAENLRNVNFKACFSSPQTRARQTCEIICGEPIILDDRLSEINCGAFEGTEETADSLQLFWQAIKNGDKGTEKFQLFVNRTLDFCNMIMKDYIENDVLIVTHSANARIINYFFEGKPDNYDFKRSVVKNGGLLTYENKS
ncbi:MAG: histidine phosphatase family protein [Paenibacillaceae bacterium]|nr:histidine phosphatase family protein [Paenibacillaceae bacterium]